MGGFVKTFQLSLTRANGNSAARAAPNQVHAFPTRTPRLAMKRRLFFPVAAWLAVQLTGCSMSAAHAAQPSYKISMAQLQRVMAKRFPRRYPVRGMIDLDIAQPQLRLLPAANRVGAQVAIHASGPLLQRASNGNIDLDFALRYEPSDRTIRAWEIAVNRVDIEGLRPDAAQLLQAYVRASASESLLELVVHQLQPKDLALADTMGLAPGEITVTEDGLVVGFVPKAH
jgi:hypothetical protein